MQQRANLFQLGRTSLAIGLTYLGLTSAPALAQANFPSSPSYEDLVQLPLTVDPDEALLASGQVITETTISMTSLTPPSLWWQQEQTSTRFGAPQLLNTWIAFSGSPQQPRRIDIVVNPQIWEALTYLERYVLLNQFGTSAKSFGYSLRVFASGRLVGLNLCDFSADAPPLDPDTVRWPEPDLVEEVSCTVVLDYLGRNELPRP